MSADPAAGGVSVGVGAMGRQVPLVAPIHLGGGDVAPACPLDALLLVASDGETAFPVRAAAVKCRSSMLLGALSLDALTFGAADAPATASSAADTPEAIHEHLAAMTGSAEKAVPLDMASADPRAVQAVATWLERHCDVAPSAIVEPMPRVVRLESLYSDAWDVQWLHTVCPEAPAGDVDVPVPSDPLAVYRVALVADALGIGELRGAALTYVAFHMQRMVMTARDPTAVMNMWLAMPSPTEAIVASADGTTTTAPAWDEVVERCKRYRLLAPHDGEGAAGGPQSPDWGDIAEACTWLADQSSTAAAAGSP